MSFFRSAVMDQYKLVVARENAWEVMNTLAQLDCLHFIDYDPALPQMSRPFAHSIQRCDDLIAKINSIEHEMRRYDWRVTKCKDVDQLLQKFSQLLEDRSESSHTYLDQLELQFDKQHHQFMQQGNELDRLIEQHYRLTEERAVLLKSQELLGQNYFQLNQATEVKFSQIVGVINPEDSNRFKRVLFRATRGNAWLNNLELNLEDPFQIQNTTVKHLFAIIYPGDKHTQLMTAKIQKVLEAFQVTPYKLPTDYNKLQLSIDSLNNQIAETHHLLAMTKQQINSYLDNYAIIQKDTECSFIEETKLFIIREKYLYQQLNYMRIQGSMYYADIWVPEGSNIVINDALQLLKSKSIGLPSGQIQKLPSDPLAVPPSYFKTNTVTWGFQEIVNTYGTPRYREVNPGLFTVMTFPFIFGVMFADIGHGLCLFLAGLYLLFFHNSIQHSDSILKLALPVRHMLTMMGFWACYNGWIYNDFISISINAFDSCYELEGNKWIRKEGCVYPFGMDPVWSVSGNQLSFMNSYKMKLAVIIGVVHMLFGIILKGVNCIHFKNWIDFFWEFIPQLIFFVCTFGFMDFLIVFKWLRQFSDTNDAPSVITLMINMALTPDAPITQPLWGDGVQQQQISFYMLAAALICAPLMLFPKPIILICQQPDHHRVVAGDQYGQMVEEDGEQDESEKHDHKSSDIFVHQVIETIEFVLGAISNTASYLRLWALSLAHSQLGEVFYSMCLAPFAGQEGYRAGISLMLGYIVFSLATFGVLMLMDVMECFLHALRLHWVEFQSKFFKADGYAFQPLSFKNVLQKHINEQDY